MSLAITSSAFAANAAIPSLCTCEGKDVSPPLAWSGVPAGTESLALIVGDPDAPDPAAPKITVLPDIKRADTSALEKAMQGHILAEAMQTGTYRKHR